MQIVIDKNTYNIDTFVEQTATTRISYVFSMPIAESNINDIKSSSEFDLVNGDITTHYDGVEFDKYSVTSDNIITFTLYKEIGKRVDDLSEKISALEISQKDQDDIIVELLSL